MFFYWMFLVLGNLALQAKDCFNNVFRGHDEVKQDHSEPHFTPLKVFSNGIWFHWSWNFVQLETCMPVSVVCTGLTGCFCYRKNENMWTFSTSRHGFFHLTLLLRPCFHRHRHMVTNISNAFWPKQNVFRLKIKINRGILILHGFFFIN